MAVLQQQAEHDQRIFGDLLHERTGGASHQPAVHESGTQKIIEKLFHQRVIPGQKAECQQAVTAVSQVVAFFTLHAVLNDLLHPIAERIDAKLPDRQRFFIIAVAGCPQDKRIVPRLQHDGLRINPATGRTLQLGITK